VELVGYEDDEAGSVLVFSQDAVHLLETRKNKSKQTYRNSSKGKKGKN
jgi:hypothetical protein